MNTHALKLFLTLSETLHFGRASQACHVSPSALSRHIKQMENSLGVKLLERDNRTVHLTRAGELLQDYAREALSQWDTLKDTLLEGEGELHGSISMYCSVTASYSFLYKILSKFRIKHPKIAIKLHTGDPTPAIARVIGGHEDISIAARPDKLPPNLAFQRITISPLVFIAPAMNFDFPKTPGEWSKTPMILSEEGLTRDRTDDWFRKLQIKPNIYAQVAGHEAIVSMVSLGFGVGVVPRIVLDNSPLAKQVKIIETQPTLPNYDVGVFVLEKRLKSPLISAFWNQLQKPNPKPG